MPLSTFTSISAISVVIIAFGTTTPSPKVVLILASGLTLPLIGLNAFGFPTDVVAMVFFAYSVVVGLTLIAVGFGSTGSSSNVMTFCWSLVAIALVAGVPINSINLAKSITLAFSDVFDVVPVAAAYVAVAYLVFESISSFGRGNNQSNGTTMSASPG
jgi:hypothetical protein